MQLWDFAKCRSVAEENGSATSDGFVKIKKMRTALIAAAAVCVVLLAVIGILIARPALVLMETPSEILARSVTYLRIYCAGIPFIVCYNFGSSILRAGGDTRRPLVFMLIAGVVKVLLNLLFVPVLHLDVGVLTGFKNPRGLAGAKKTMIEAMRSDLETRFRDRYEKGEVHLLAASNGSPEMVEKWVAEIQAAFPGMEVLYAPLSLGISCHIGPDALGIGCSCVPAALRK